MYKWCTSCTCVSLLYNIIRHILCDNDMMPVFYRINLQVSKLEMLSTWRIVSLLGLSKIELRFGSCSYFINYVILKLYNLIFFWYKMISIFFCVSSFCVLIHVFLLLILLSYDEHFYYVFHVNDECLHDQCLAYSEDYWLLPKPFLSSYSWADHQYWPPGLLPLCR